MIIQIGTEVDESRILWKYKESDEWKRADIDDLIEAYENRQKEPKPGDSISRQALIDEILEDGNGAVLSYPAGMYEDELVERIEKQMIKHFIGVIEYVPPVKPKPVCEDAISKHDLWRIIEDNAYWVTYNETSKEKGMTLTGINQALNECPPVELKIYGNEHNCIMTMFGECSYSETGCGSCEVVEKVRDALKGECPPVEPERPKGTETMIVDGMEMEIDPVSYEVGYTHGQFSERPKGEWIGEGDGYADGGIVYDTWYCSECDHCEEGEELALPNFCPECGADMRGDKE